MKPTFLIILIFLFATSCQTDETMTNVAKSNRDSIELNRHSYIKSILNGDWYEQTYIEDIQKTKSPFRSKNALASIVEINIDTAKTIGDTLEVGAPSIHEGYSFRIIFNSGLTNNSVKTDIVDYDENESDFFELGYNISNQDTTLIIYRYDKNKKPTQTNNI